jgi:3-deoxy-D-manno-octulosonate 8-phosphate phosphatase (KDO 8-P phosphatase)
VAKQFERNDSGVFVTTRFNLTQKELKVRLRAVKMLLFYVDGVLTDGRIIWGESGEYKAFDAKDGLAVALARRAGFKTGIITAKSSKAVVTRAAELKMDVVYQNTLEKILPYEEILESFGLADGEVCYMGDDLFDLAVLNRVGFSAAPADAAPEVRESVHWVSGYPGGRGAVRELVEMLLKARDRWDPMLHELGWVSSKKANTKP